MNELITTQESNNGEIVISGRELHEFLQVRSNYTTWFERMTEYGFVEGQDYVSTNSKIGIRHYEKDHHLKLDMAKEISMLQRSDKGKQARQYFLQLEKLWNSPEMVMKRALEHADKQMKDMKAQIEANEPYTTFGKVVSNTDAAINIGAYAKMIYEKHGVNIGRNKLMAWFREHGYLIKMGREKNNAKQKYIEQGLFKLSPTVVSRTQGDYESMTTLITGKGQVKFLPILLEEFKQEVR